MNANAQNESESAALSEALYLANDAGRLLKVLAERPVHASELRSVLWRLCDAAGMVAETLLEMKCDRVMGMDHTTGRGFRIRKGA